MNQDVMVHAGGVSMQRWLGGAAGLAAAGRAGMAVAGSHWHCRWGEHDLVLERQQQLLVVEVKGRRNGCRDRHGLMPFTPPKGAAWLVQSVVRELCIRRQLSSCSGASWPLFP